jgi:RNA polymerase primary sigma factor/RNA polymerase nonessential primary-like sigma factor
MSTSEVTKTESFHDHNIELFEQRSQIQSELSSLDADADDSVRPNAGDRRRRRMLCRRLDDVTAEIISYNMGLVRSYTRRFSSTASVTDRQEFESAGTLGLMRAVDSYDPECGSFGQWAFKPIQREVLRSVRDVDHSNLSLGDFEKRPAILRAYRQLKSLDESYEPTAEEVATLVGVPVAQARRVMNPPKVESMHQRIGHEDDAELGDTIESDAPGAEAQILSKITLAALETFGLPAMDARELYVIVRRFGLDGDPIEKLADIGTTLGLSREAIRQIESKALAKLQHPLILGKLATSDANGQVMTRQKVSA